MRSRLARLERTTRAIVGGTCPVCFGHNGEGFNARIWMQAGNEPPVLNCRGSGYDEPGVCVRCGARAREIVMHFPGVGCGGVE